VRATSPVYVGALLLASVLYATWIRRSRLLNEPWRYRRTIIT